CSSRGRSSASGLLLRVALEFERHRLPGAVDQDVHLVTLRMADDVAELLLRREAHRHPELAIDRWRLARLPGGAQQTDFGSSRDRSARRDRRSVRTDQAQLTELVRV